MVPVIAGGCDALNPWSKVNATETELEDAEVFDESGIPANLPPEVRAQIEQAMRDARTGSGLPRYFNDTSEWETTAMRADGQLVVPRTGMAAVVAEGVAYVIGGHGPGLTQAIFRSDLEVIDSNVHVERMKTSLMRRRYQTAEVHKGRIYIVTGMSLAGGHWDWRKVFPDDLEIFDLATGTISKGAPIPVSRYLASSEILNGRIFVLGGSPPRLDSQRETDGRSYQSNANNRPDNRIFIYDIAKDRWSEGAPMEVARQCELVAHDGKLYAVAGFDGRRALAAFEEYDPKTNRWTRLPDLPFTLSGQKCVVVGDLLYCFGDYTEMTQICAYDFKTKTWSKLSLRMKPMRQGAAVLLGDQILVIGGNAGEGRAIRDGGAGADPLSTIQSFLVADLKKAVGR